MSQCKVSPMREKLVKSAPLPCIFPQTKYKLKKKSNSSYQINTKKSENRWRNSRFPPLNFPLNYRTFNAVKNEPTRCPVIEKEGLDTWGGGRAAVCSVWWPHPSQHSNAPPSLRRVGCMWHGARRDSWSHCCCSSSADMDVSAAGRGVHLRGLLKRNWLLVATVSSVLLGTCRLMFAFCSDAPLFLLSAHLLCFRERLAAIRLRLL